MKNKQNKKSHQLYLYNEAVGEVSYRRYHKI